MIKYKNKSKLGVFFSGIFVLATAINSYGALDDFDQTTNIDPTVDPYVNVIKINSPSAMTFSITETDINKAGQIASHADADLDSEVYVIVGQYEACILSNALVADATTLGGGDAGILMQVNKASSSNYYKVTDSSINQLALYNGDTGKKIKVLLMVTPAGHSASDNTFGSGTASTTYFSTQYAATNFIIGGDASTGAGYSASYNDANATTHADDVTYENLALDSWGAINHFGMNPDLQAADLTAAEATAVKGLDDLSNGEVHAITAASSNSCEGDVDPRDSIVEESMIMTIMVYANAADLATASAGSYSTEFEIKFGDVNDVDANDLTPAGV